MEPADREYKIHGRGEYMEQTASMSRTIFETKREIIRSREDNTRYQKYKEILGRKYDSREACMQAIVEAMKS